MPNFAPMLRTSLLAVIGIGAGAATALAQSAPKAQCPNPTADESQPLECPPPVTAQAPQQPVEEPMAEPAPEPVQPEPAYTYTQPAEQPITETRTAPLGIAVSLGGGVSGFTNDRMRDTTNDGGSWGVRAAVGLRSYIGLEAEYTGTAQSIDALGIDNDSVLVGNGAQGALRVNVLPNYAVQPFVFGGVAWRHYELTNEGINTSDISNTDDVMEIPMGAGLAWNYRGLLLDARGEYRYATFADMVPNVTKSGDASMNRWGVNANIGYAF